MRLSILVFALLPACGGQPPPDANAKRMQRHFYEAIVMREAVIRGDLPSARASGEVLAAAPTTSADARWAGHVERVRTAALAGAKAKGIIDAALAVGELGAACGACHQALGVELDSPPDPWPDVRPDAEGHMLRHQWAAERMWDGLIRPSRDAWLRGVDALYEKPLPTTHLPLRKVDLRDVTHSITARGPVAEPAERGQIYGTFVATCAVCHTSERR